jgi:hypothetical protein
MTQECLDMRMVMRTLEQSGSPLSIGELQRHWSPVFTYKDLERMTRQLRSQGLVREIHRAGRRLVACTGSAMAVVDVKQDGRK